MRMSFCCRDICQILLAFNNFQLYFHIFTVICLKSLQIFWKLDIQILWKQAQLDYAATYRIAALVSQTYKSKCNC